MRNVIYVLSIMIVLPMLACAKESADITVSTPVTVNDQSSVVATVTPSTVGTTTTETQSSGAQTIKENEVTEVPASTSSGSQDSTNAPVDLVSKFVSGRDYMTLVPAKPTSSPTDVVEVTELFMYSCPHCYSFEPFIQTWLAKDKPADVAFVRIPANFNEMAIVHTRAFYALQAMGVLDQALHQAIFDEYHNNKNRLKDKQAVANFVAKQGVDSKVFLETYDSFGVNASFRKAEELAQSYRANSVPLIVINGRYVISGKMAGTEQKFADTMNYLVELEQQRLAAEQQAKTKVKAN
ncbi:MAG: thiol:disulfide interchange protein DsbA/DsbL [Gammaproteobacteria bacterium]|nr:thiol:disulfide interchange protein DsbA/DsbL [Gammaproteobacteria bacterium]